MLGLNRVESWALGVAGGAGVAGIVGVSWKLVVLGLVVAVASQAWRRFVPPLW